MQVPCIACGGGLVKNLGRLPNFTSGLQGQPAGAAGPVSWLYACEDCSLRFRVPIPTDEELTNYYAALLANSCWQYEGDRAVWHEVRSVLQEAPGRTVLDVGCFRGDLLTFLDDDWQLFGVEPSADARREAQAHGVEIIAHSLDELRHESRQFAAITLIDVIEHLPRPFETLKMLSDLLVKGGRLVLFTGSTDAWSWRIAGVHYWYCAMPEHIAFFRPSWFRWAAPRLGYEVSSVKRMAYNPSPLRIRLDESLKNIAFSTYQRLLRSRARSDTYIKVPLLKRISSWESCWWTSARDHILVTLSKMT